MATAEALTPAVPTRDPSPRLWSEAEFARMLQLGQFGSHDVELRAGVVCARETGRPFVYTRKEYYALGDNHFFRDPFFDSQRVQLIGGEIVEESPMNTPRATAVTLGMYALQSVFGVGHHVRVQLPLDLGLISEPEPDLAAVTGSARDYLADHPKTALLVIEVSDTTVEYDTHDKASLYAAGGIADYWVIDLTTDRVLVFRSPRPEIGTKFGSRYGAVTPHGRDDVLTPLAAPNARVAAGDLLP